MIAFGADAFRIEGTVASDSEEVKITIACAKNNPKYPGRMAKVNNSAFVSPSRIAGNFYRVIFSPVHLNIISGGPALRRKFADACLCQMYPGFMENYRQYLHVIDQRNNFLKSIKNYDKNQQDAIFETLDTSLSALGYEIYKMRNEFTQLLAE
jgi:DNA replication and repair protein RecF